MRPLYWETYDDIKTYEYYLNSSAPQTQVSYKINTGKNRTTVWCVESNNEYYSRVVATLKLVPIERKETHEHRTLWTSKNGHDLPLYLTSDRIYNLYELRDDQAETIKHRFYELCSSLPSFELNDPLLHLLKEWRTYGYELRLSLDLTNCMDNASIKNLINKAMVKLFSSKLTVVLDTNLLQPGTLALNKEDFNFNLRDSFNLSLDYCFGYFTKDSFVLNPTRNDSSHREGILSFYYQKNSKLYNDFYYENFKSPLPIEDLRKIITQVTNSL